MRVFSIFVGVILAACTTRHDGAPQQVATPAPDAAPDGAPSSLRCDVANGDYVCPRAQRGLAISPVPLDLSSCSDEQAVRIGYGSYLVNATSDCSECHSSAAGFLAGGNPFAADKAGHTVFSRNLTPDKTGLQLTEDQFVTAIRTGKDFHEGAQGVLVVMPWPAFRWASDGDLRAIYAYLRAIPPVSNLVPPDQKMGLPLPPEVPFTGVYTDGEVPRTLPPDDGSLGPNIERGFAIEPLAQTCDHGDADFGRGSYLANSLSECSECHTKAEAGAPPGRDHMLHLMTQNYMTGGNVFVVPPPLQPMLKQTRTMSANLTGAKNGYFHERGTTLEEFIALIRTQSHIDENPPRPLGFPMPAMSFAHELDQDLKSVFTYGTEVRPNTTADEKRQDYARWCAADSDCNVGESCHLDATVGNECVGKTCAADDDCDACQTCGGGACVAPAPDSACIANAF